MTIGLKIEENVTEVLDAIEGEIPDGVEKGLLRAAEFVVGEIRKQVISTFNPSTGALARSYKAQLLRSGNTVVAGALSDSVYAGIQDRGGTINAKGKKLAVPVGAGRSLPVGTGPRDVPGLVLIPRPSGNALLAKVRSDGKLDVYFVLKDSVTLKGEHYLEAAAKESADDVTEILSEELQDLIDEKDSD